MTLFWRRFSLCLTFGVTAIFVVPTYFTYGLETVYNKELNVTGTACRRLASTTRTLSLIRSATYVLLGLGQGRFQQEKDKPIVDVHDNYNVISCFVST